MQGAKHLRVFAHYVLGRLVLLFFFCHPGTLATFSDGQAYLLNRYPNRDIVTTEGQLVSEHFVKPLIRHEIVVGVVVCAVVLLRFVRC